MDIITPQEFKELMIEIKNNDDGVNTPHVDADFAMCEVLSSLGYEEGVEVFRTMKGGYL